MNKLNKHASHIIIIEDHSFKANDSGMWNLTEIWKVLELTRAKAPSQWRTKSAVRLEALQKMHRYNGEYIYADKQATLKYAGWVSADFEDMVYAAFEAILEMPEIAEVVANKMIELGYQKEAELLERHKDDYREAMRNLNKIGKRVDGRKPERIYKAVLNGNMTKSQGLSLIPRTSVWYTRIMVNI
ncbi:hypothetical protein [Pectobacterium carotovorum]|uniref:hypothetical protein n=1 Tax=Pectobacterium carotovorum TaxID=554 RepID=UPI0001A42E1C|nr:hypothetical protein [Pectobacterium carotovorum]KFX02300.1 hypothetical protein JV33_04040 [Pectobacterium carotovorum subsp. carotovorum]KML72157.1 hypothetical protein G032_03555 [Pectobacterium carotovorum subsp. carotovorum ICMP 5702]MBA0177175.1 hypothetical protein [Pectobacterium carotovorum]MDK9421740.1 hypothetical protein [Pectobacterium carotovorum]QHP55589.1 hypothetical protein EH203_18180 [Pectobacterium carotovorum subsp. carotovorum]